MYIKFSIKILDKPTLKIFFKFCKIKQLNRNFILDCITLMSYPYGWADAMMKAIRKGSCVPENVD